MANSVNYQHFKTLLNAYEKAYPEKNKNACQNYVAENNSIWSIYPYSKLPLQPKKKWRERLTLKMIFLVGLYRKRDIGQLSQNDRNEISSREATLKKYKADLKQKELNRKRQQKFRSNQKRKLIEIEKQNGDFRSSREMKRE